MYVHLPGVLNVVSEKPPEKSIGTPQKMHSLKQMPTGVWTNSIPDFRLLSVSEGTTALEIKSTNVTF